MLKRQLLVTIPVIIATILLGSSGASAFDLPKKDPWFFQSTEAGYVFSVPDKAQHYYGSMLLTSTFRRFPLPAEKVTVPVLAFTAGFFWEVWQESRGIGFQIEICSLMPSESLPLHFRHNRQRCGLTIPPLRKR